MVKITDENLEKIVDDLLGLRQYPSKSLCVDCGKKCKSVIWEAIYCEDYIPITDMEDDDNE